MDNVLKTRRPPGENSAAFLQIMKFLRIYFNYFLFILGMRSVLSRDLINKVVPVECHEPLVVLSGPDIFTRGEILVRTSVSGMLSAVAKSLNSNGFKLFVYDGYRSNERQREQWNNAVEKMRRGNPEMSDTQIEMLVQKQVARPDGIGSGHQTGGAVDLTLCSLDGTPLFMGTKYIEFNELTKTGAIIEDAAMRERRKTLLSAMREAGFVNYPNEWWHYSYGDRMWAAYSRKKTCLYGVL